MVPSTEPVPIAAGSLVVLVGPVASGKSTWAAEQVAASSIVSSDALRALVGEGEHDLRASADAFALLEQIVTLRAKRRLTTVIDTLGLDAGQRETWRRIAHAAGVPAIAVVFDTPASECRRRNAERDMPVPADVVRAQLTRWPEVVAAVAGEPWDQVLTAVPVDVVPPALTPRRRPSAAPDGSTLDSTLDSTLAPVSTGSTMRIGLQLSSFTWPGGPPAMAERLGDIAARAEAAGVAHLWVMDHLRQIPQVGPAWNDLPDPFTVLAWLAARTRRVGLGVLVSPAFLRPLATVAKAYATLDVLSGGRAVCGLGVGWFEQEYRAGGHPLSLARRTVRRHRRCARGPAAAVE